MAIKKEKKAAFYELRGKINFQLNRMEFALKDWDKMAKLDTVYESRKKNYLEIAKR